MVKISNWQLFWLILTLEISMSMWLTISPAIQAAKQDAWLSLILAGIIGLAVTLIIIKVCQQHHSQSLIELSQTLFGKWVGKLISILYVATWYVVASNILRIFAEFIQQTLFHNTPYWIISACMVAAITFITYIGSIESIGRFNEMAGPLLLISITITLILNVPNLHLSLLMPVYYDSGTQSILKGSLSNASFLGESILLMMLNPFLAKPQQALRPALLAILIPSILTVMTAAMVVATFGNVIGGSVYFPYFSMVRFINVLGFIQNMDVWIVFIWIFSVYVKLAVYLFVNSYGSAQLLGFKKWRRMIFFTSPAIFVLSVLPRNLIIALDFKNEVWLGYVFPILIIGLPLIMLVMGKLRGTQAHSR
ncbi:GerAB/ArcD/ProY family transporter [Paenibacillus albus]|uniref:Uncharacterized protein n=1 Tax=Paenibacillus albus TaxID=2495582 RepID=A0A3Q8X575_9BACL|nr:endospore germination permease [Paenibacillus albus]AZN40800.1 hypothetical protein EJC50_14860 [Paenibacillus albus]